MKKWIIMLIMTILIILSLVVVNKSLKSEDVITSDIVNENNVSKELYKNPIVPEGFSKVETENASWELDENGNVKGWNNGLVIQDEKENQFVWVPCSIEENNEVPLYSRYFAHRRDEIGIPRGDEEIEDGRESETGFVNYYKEMNPINDEVKKNVEQYGGFYIGRYETGIENGVLKTTVNEKEKIDWTGWENGTAVIKPNMEVWNYITIERAIKKSQEIVNNDSAKTYLMTSYCYDTVSKWIDMSESNPFINKKDEYLKFAKDNLYKTSYTGSNEQWDFNNINNIFDNIIEYTTERYIGYSRGGMVCRYGVTDETYSLLSYAVDYRSSLPMNFAGHKHGFRAILIIK